MRLPSYRLGVVLALILQVGLLGWLIADRAMLLQNGKEIRLAVVPIDPRDLFRGDYVTLNYDISRVRNDAVAGDDAFTWGDAIYVSIEPVDGGGWKVASIGHTQPASGTFLKGTVAGVGDSVACDGGATACMNYDVAYNLEQFFVPEGTGRELESLRTEQRISVDVAVASDGRAALKRLLVDGQPRFEEQLF
jgi:uncharacterized membrane-anchored protein